MQYSIDDCLDSLLDILDPVVGRLPHEETVMTSLVGVKSGDLCPSLDATGHSSVDRVAYRSAVSGCRAEISRLIGLVGRIPLPASPRLASVGRRVTDPT